MDKQKRKDLVFQYMNTKKDMGVYSFYCKVIKKHYIGYSQNTKATLNSYTFRLNANNHSCKELQDDWNKYGEDSFEVKVLENLEYDKEDDNKSDYTLDLTELLDSLCLQFENTTKIK
ncbi:MAG: GIY-YIG nuclease family protein [Lachnospirales bacterium]